MGYTKGEWKVQDCGNFLRIVCDDVFIAEITGLSKYQDTSDDAKLISAAPSLLEACKKAINFIDDGRTPSNNICAKTILELAIKKATGE